MKRITILLLLTALLLGMAPAPAASGVEALTALARYFPEQTIFFAAARLDDTAFSDMDALLGYIKSHIPEADLPADSFEALLDMALTGEAGMAGDFESLVGTWLGDTVAVGVFSFQSLMMGGQGETGPLVIAAELDDRAGAETFFGALLRSSNYEMTREDGQTLFSPASPRSPALLLTDDVLLVAAQESWLTNAPSATLADNEMFTRTAGQLPAESYNFLVYLDYQGIMQPMMGFMAMGGGAQMGDMDAVLEIFGPQMYAFTLLDNRTLVMDIAIGYNDLTALEDVGFVLPTSLPSVDLSFAAHAPAQMPLFMQSADLGPMTLLQFENLRALAPFYADMMQQQLEQMQQNLVTSALYEAFDIGKLITFLNMGFAGFTGLNLEHDVLPWMQGDYALFLQPIEAETPIGFTLDLAFVTETADTGAAQNLIVSLNEAVEAYKGVYETEKIGEHPILVLPNIIPSFFPGADLQAPELDILFGVSSDVFAAGTREGVGFSLAPDEDESLAKDPVFMGAARYFLEDAYQVLYLNPGGFDVLLEAIRSHGSSRDADDLERLLGLFESASVTGTWEDNAALSRAVITLAD